MWDPLRGVCRSGGCEVERLPPGTERCRGDAIMIGSSGIGIVEFKGLALFYSERHVARVRAREIKHCRRVGRLVISLCFQALCFRVFRRMYVRMYLAYWR